MSNQNTLEKLYLAIDSAEDAQANPFETVEFQRVYENFCNKRIETESTPVDVQNEIWEEFIEVIMITRETAFKVGFKTAVELMMGDCKNG